MAHPYLALRPTRNGRVSHYAVAGSKNPLPLGMGNVKKKYLRPLLDSGALKMTIPDKPNSRNQKYITVRTD